MVHPYIVKVVEKIIPDLPADFDQPFARFVVSPVTLKRYVDPIQTTNNKFWLLLSDDLGEFLAPPVALKVDQTVNAIHLPARRIPIGLRVSVEEELEKLILQGILERVDYSEWATPIVPVLKPDGSDRI